MKKYDLSKIMKRAWELVKKAGMTISSGLKKAWEEAKDMKEQLIAAMENLADMAACEGWNYKVYSRDWQKYGKNRTYFSIYETRNCSKHNREYECGYYDNINGVYVPGKIDLTARFNLSGERF
ncbi:MAG: hypothetical protein KH230_15460 [Enterocloster asparagiformis]|nr:hypothetical protein [Enterocloster asparagiformis]